MKTLTLTDAEFAILQQSVEVNNDMLNDMLLESFSMELFPRGDEVTTLNEAQAKVFRAELNDAVNRVHAMWNLMTKLGLKVNKAGYSV